MGSGPDIFVHRILTTTLQGCKLLGTTSWGLGASETVGGQRDSPTLQGLKRQMVSCPAETGGGTIRCPEKRVQSGQSSQHIGLAGGSELWLPGGPIEVQRMAGG